MDSLIAADAAVRQALPAIVGRYRAAGVLTWVLLYEIEADVLTHLASRGQHHKRTLDLLRAPASLDYPRDERPASFEGGDLVPVVFQEIEEVWRRAARPHSSCSSRFLLEEFDPSVSGLLDWSFPDLVVDTSRSSSA
jgi:hypothetical protein